MRIPSNWVMKAESHLIGHTGTHILCSMKNVTLAVGESTLREARRIAAERSTSLNAMIREFLEQLTERESRAVEARRRIVELCERSKAEVGGRRPTRDEVHER